MIRRLTLIAFATLALCGCGGSAPKGAVEAAQRLTVAALQNDRVAFEAEIDRPAVRDDVRRQLAAMAKDKSLDVEGGPSEFALDRMIGPDAVRLVDPAGHAATVAPSAEALARQMRTQESGQVCLQDAARPDSCLLTFAKAKGSWRLVGMQASDIRIQVAAR